MSAEQSSINPLVRADMELDSNTVKFIPPELQQEWGQALAEIAIWGSVLNELLGQTHNAQVQFSAAQKHRNEIVRRLNGS